MTRAASPAALPTFLAVCGAALVAAPQEEALPPRAHESPPVESAPAPLVRRLDERGLAPVALPSAGIQVNVDAQGRNVRGDAANEPSLAVDPTDPARIAIGWRQFASIASSFREAGVAVSLDGGHHFAPATVLDAGAFRTDPVLAAGPDGTFYYYSLNATLRCDLFRSVNSGLDWIGPAPANGGDKAWMTVDGTGGPGHGNVYLVWSNAVGCCGERTFSRSRDGGLSFLDPVAVAGSPAWGTLAVGPDGELYAAGLYGPAFDLARLSVARAATPWSFTVPPRFENVAVLEPGGTLVFFQPPNPEGLAGQVWVATNHAPGPRRGEVYLLASIDPVDADPLDLHFFRSSDGGRTWTPPIRVNDDGPGNAQWFGSMDVAPNGRIDVVWNDTRADPSGATSQLYYSFSSDGGDTWSPNDALTQNFDHGAGYPVQRKLGDYFQIRSDDVGVHVAYAATFQGEEDVYSLRIGAFDCNGNGRADEEDVRSGRSLDAGADGIPDECQAPLLLRPSPGIAGVQNHFALGRATPGELVGWFLGAGSVPAASFPPAQRFLLESPVLVAATPADAHGVARLTAAIPAGASGATVTLQAVELHARRISNVLTHEFP